MGPENHGTTAEERRSHKLLGMEFAPIRIPLERRLQTLAVLMWISLFLFFTSICAVVFVTCLLYEKYRWIAALYLAWAIYDWRTPYNGGRKTKAIVRWCRGWRIWQYYRDYYPIRLVKTAELDPERSYLIGSHPHGILCSGAFGAFATDALGFEDKFPGLERALLTLQGQFWVPFYREIFMGVGTAAATKDSMEVLLSRPKGQATVLVTGGVLEAMNAGVGQTIKLVLQRRKGWIKLALRFGVDIVPSFSFGEHSVYGQISYSEGSTMRRIQEWFESWAGFSPIFMLGRGVLQYNFGIVPHRQPVHVVVGAPIRVDKVENPTCEQINALHEKYCQTLQQLYDEYNPLHGDKDITLEIT